MRLDEYCLPLPRHSVYGENPQFAAFSPSAMVWLSKVDERVGSRAANLLCDVCCGELSFEIMQVFSGQPSFGDDESYTITRRAGGFNVRAATTWGGLHAVTTLHQLGQVDALAKVNEIKDCPRFAWRGVLIDVARHFMSIDLLARVVEGLSLLKLNVLHLHLSDDQAFRFNSDKFPKLASPQSYSKQMLKNLVAYAADRGVRVVPEIDVPGHVNTWLVSYPAWGMQQVSATQRFGVHQACLNPADENTYRVLSDLFTEVAEVFTDEYLHIGGDEVHPAWWVADSSVAELMQAHQLKDVKAVQNYFNHRVCEIARSLGKTVVGWDEVLHPDMPQMVVQNWRGVTTRDEVLARSLDCLVSAPYYLDLFYSAEMYYAFDPEGSQIDLLALEDKMQLDLQLAHVSEGIEWTRRWRDSAIDHHHGTGQVIGGEACLWSELVDEATLETRLWSRLPAVAERLWSPAQVKDVDSLYTRMTDFLALPAIQLEQNQSKALRNIGLAGDDIDIVKMLEPVKWYARLLGERALRARLSGNEMPQARPYNMHTPLNRIVDFISPESLDARGLVSVSEKQLLQKAQVWQALSSQNWPQDITQAIEHLSLLGKLVCQYLSGRLDRKAYRNGLLELYVPVGEYLLAPIPHLLKRLQAGSETCR
ncbi:MAG: family 20 glycosylhydrolase [Gammaproteobacteria bacterium]|nr:family 20 glycosylhydrolase [Gammaproteobacteria bacterium]